MRMLIRVLLLLLPLMAGIGTAGASPGPSQETAIGRVTYVTRTSAYVDRGSEHGLTPGARLEVVRGDSTIAILEAAHVAGSRSSCRVVSAAGEIAVGDAVRFDYDPGVLDLSEPEAAVLEEARRARRRRSELFHPLREWGLRGRLGVRYLAVRDHAVSGGGFAQPALDARLTGKEVGGSPWSLEVDVRARRTYLEGAETGSEGRTRVYRLGASWQRPESPWRFSAGRQVSGDLSVVSIFDGLLAEVRQARWSAGVFAGTQPRPGDLAATTSVIEGGGFGSLSGTSGGAGRWKVTLGAISSHEEGTVNREYLFLRGHWNNRKLFGFLSQEVDVNRGWKQDAGETAVSPTSTYLSLRYQWLDALALQGGVDTRRNVRLYRDRVTPETDFDDSYRQGYWAGVNLGPRWGLRAGLHGRSNTGSGNGTSNSGTLTLRADRRAWIPVDLSSRHTRYSGPVSEGWLHSLAASLPWGPRRRFEVHAGVRDEQRDPAFGSDTRTTWVGADLDLGIGRWVYLLLSAEATRSDLEDNDQVYSSLTYRF